MFSHLKNAILLIIYNLFSLSAYRDFYCLWPVVEKARPAGEADVELENKMKCWLKIAAELDEGKNELLEKCTVVKISICLTATRSW